MEGMGGGFGLGDLRGLSDLSDSVMDILRITGAEREPCFHGASPEDALWLRGSRGSQELLHQALLFLGCTMVWLRPGGNAELCQELCVCFILFLQR